MTVNQTITRLLIANRGEIARRIIRTAHAMGISTVAVYADGDRNSPYVREADQAISLDGKSAAETYLDIAKVLDAGKRSGADAVHPGYGFLSENASFATSVQDAGFVWVGPPPSAIKLMGDKLSSRELMQQSGVPVLQAERLDDGDDITAAAQRLGYPLLVKASAGGGGKGMRVVQTDQQLSAAVEGARRESAAAFGDDTVFLERWLSQCRHVEVQVLADNHGNVIHCFERECSIQRRHQKIIEEAPSPAVTPQIRERMVAAAIAAAKAIQYRSAGTVEFLLSGDELWFLEMNTRLQVEHPVTELITHLDLVRQQLLIAQGEPLALGQTDLRIDGHAIEARLYAEDPANDFLPDSGTLTVWEPACQERARIDSGVETGSRVGIEFDPMLAKVIVHAPSRQEAAMRLARVLEKTRIGGLRTNRDFLISALRSSAFLSGDTTTDFVHCVDLPRSRYADDDQLARAAIAVTLFAQAGRRDKASVLRSIPSGWRNTKMPPESVAYRYRDKEFVVEYRIRRDGSFDVEALGRAHRVAIERRMDDQIDLTTDGVRETTRLVRDCDRWYVHRPAIDLELVQLPRFPVAEGDIVSGGLSAPMPGVVIAVHVGVGDAVQRGDLLLTLEAMKMENHVTAPKPGIVAAIHVAQADQVTNGQLLIVLDD